MSRKLKSLICALMAGTMLATSTGLTVLADDPADTKVGADGAAVEATEVPETLNGADVDENEKDAEHAADAAAEAPTEAPTEEPKAGYEADVYYQNALKVVSALGIITGYDDGSIKPESTVTRAEMAAIVLRMLKQEGNVTYKNVFTDLSADHWAANTVQTAVEQGILDGMGDGTFVPDGNVKYEQVMKMLVCAVNYTADAEAAGGYPNGYITAAGSLDMLDGVKGALAQDMPRGEVIKAVYNALCNSYKEITDWKNGVPKYEAKDTLGVAVFNMYEDEGVLTATPNRTIAAGTTKKPGIVTIDGVDYKCDLNVDEFLATKVKFYYIDDKADDPSIVAMFTKGKSTTVTIDADDLASIDVAGGSLKVYKSKTSVSTTNYKINNITVVYNGDLLAASDVVGDYNEFITPKVGTIKLTDYDDDGTYDTMFVEKYETMLVTNATTEKLTGKINNANVTLEYDLDDNDYTVTVSKNGNSASVKNLRKNDVASIKRNVAEDTIDIVVTGESITGEITSVGEDDGDTTVTVNGQEYKVDTNAVADVRTGISGQFFTDMFNRIGYINSDGALSGSEKYAMITKAFYNDEHELVIRLYNQEGVEVEAKPSGSMRYWGPGASGTKNMSEDELCDDLNDESKYLKCANQPVKLCKYSLNSKNELSKLYVAVEATAANIAAGALTLNNQNMNGVSTVGGTLNGYSINDGIVEFSVPNTAADRGSGSNYSVGTVTSSAYKSFDGGVNIDFMIGGFSGSSSKAAEVLVKFTTSATSMWGIKELSTASAATTMLISKINEAVDAEDNTIFEIRGYSGGKEISYMTTSTTGIYKFTTFTQASEEYVGGNIFNATADDPSKLYSVLQPGDIVAVATSGSDIRTMVKMVDINDVASLAVTGTASNAAASDAINSLPYTGSAKSSNTRNIYYMGFISSVDINDSAFIGFNDATGSGNQRSVSYDTNSVFSYVTINVNANGKITDVKVDKNDGIEPAELYSMGDEENTVDFGMFSSMRGNMGNGYIVRVVIDK